MDGTCTDEHGTWIEKMESLAEELEMDAIGVMQKLENDFDSLSIMKQAMEDYGVKLTVERDRLTLFAVKVFKPLASS